jgi:hypothetical protein
LLDQALTAAAIVVFGLALIWVYTNINWITGSNIRSAAGRVIPVLEASDEEPRVNRSEDHTPKPVLLPASTETLPEESIDMATDPQASEAVEFVLHKPSAESARVPAPPVQPAADPPSFESSPSENTPAFSQDPAQQTAEPYTEEIPLPVPSQTAPADMLMGTETPPQHPQPPPEPVTDTRQSLQPPPSDREVDARPSGDRHND